MNTFRAFIVSFCLLLLVVFAYSPSVAAVNIFGVCKGQTIGGTDVCNNVSTQQKRNTDPILVVMKTTISVISYIIGIAAIIIIIIGGIRLAVSGGDSQSVASARSSILYALLGIAIAILAQVIVAFVLKNIA